MVPPCLSSSSLALAGCIRIHLALLVAMRALWDASLDHVVSPALGWVPATSVPGCGLGLMILSCLVPSHVDVHVAVLQGLMPLGVVIVLQGV